MLQGNDSRRDGQSRADAPAAPEADAVRARRRSCAWLVYRLVTGQPDPTRHPGLAHRATRRSSSPLGLILILGTVIFIPFLTAGRSPHTLLRPSDSNVRLDDVVGADQTKREAIDSMNLFLASETFEREMGGNARRGVLFEGLPGTGKTHLAKAMAAEAGVPFLFVSASEFQSMYYGQTNKKIRSFFKALRKAARDEGGAIGYIEEFDAIGGARSGMNTGSMREGIVGVVNELLVQMQSFDLPDRIAEVQGVVDRLDQRVPPRRAAQAAPDPQGGERPDRRLDEPRRRSRPGAAATRPVRPRHHVQPAGPHRPGGDRRVLPRQEEPRRRGDRAAGRRPHRRLHAGAHREAARRGADHRPALPAHEHDRERRARSTARHRGRHRPRDGLPPRRAAPHRHPRGRPRARPRCSRAAT